MKEITITVPFQEGLHARPAVRFIRMVGPLKSDIIILKDGNQYAAKSIVSLLSAGITYGQQIVIQATGEDEDESIAMIKTFFGDITP